jgi:hypothetical protein
VLLEMAKLLLSDEEGGDVESDGGETQLNGENKTEAEEGGRQNRRSRSKGREESS